jgi:hypothetical protein
MNRKNLKKLTRGNTAAEFAAETRFDVNAGASREAQKGLFEPLKKRLLQEQLWTLTELSLHTEVRRAANEAAALAWLTPFPVLLFPVLFQEKAEEALHRAAAQDRILERSRLLMEA